MDFSTGLVFKATCHHIERYDPCLRYLLSDPAAQARLESLANMTKDIVNQKLVSEGIMDRLDALIVQKIQKRTQQLRGARQGIPRAPILGAVLFAGGGVLSFSRNEWVIDEGYIGVSVAIVGLGLMLKPLIAKWRNSSVNASRTGFGIQW